MNLHETEAGLAWVNLFKVQDRPAALQLLQAVRWISAAELTDALTKSIVREAEKIPGPIALFVEQDLKEHRGKVERFYKQTQKPKRAHGVALPPVRSKQLFNHEVGSEGVIGNIATALKRRSPKNTFSTPLLKNSQIKGSRVFHPGRYHRFG